MSKINSSLIFALCAVLLSSCQAIGDIFSAGVWVGIAIVVIIIIVLFSVFRKRS